MSDHLLPFSHAVRFRHSPAALVSVDIPSGWDVEEGNVLGLGLEPHMLVSLTAPKLCARFFAGVHYVGGRFVTPGLAAKYGIVLPNYQGCNQFVRL